MRGREQYRLREKCGGMTMFKTHRVVGPIYLCVRGRHSMFVSSATSVFIVHDFSDTCVRGEEV